MDINTDNKQQNKKSFKFFGRIALILFIGMSLYLFVSAIILVFLTKPGREIMIPNVTGKRFVDVYNSLVRKNLVPEIKFYDVYDIDNGIILNQYPEHGKIVYEGEKIKLTVSRSETYIPVPNLIGTKLPFALNKLKKLHYNDRSYAIGTGVISYLQTEKYAESVIIEQSPDAGEEISPDRKINLLVSAGKTETEMRMPDLSGQSIDLCLDLLLAKGLTINEEIILIDSSAKSGMIESQAPKPDEIIQPGDLVKLKVYYFPQKDRPYTSFERIIYTILSDEHEGLYDGYVDDNRSKRICFSKKMKSGGKIDFVFKRRGNADISITNNKKEIIEEINIKPDDFN